MASPLPPRWGPLVLSVLPIVAAFLFLAHGAQKLFAWPTSEAREAVALASLMGLAGVLEFFGGFLLLLGLLTRPVAFVLAGEMAVYFSTSRQWVEAPGAWMRYGTGLIRLVLGPSLHEI
jgi:uncharacterized membrane protein YphA (DoxX/SURF4 family)